MACTVDTSRESDLICFFLWLWALWPARRVCIYISISTSVYLSIHVLWPARRTTPPAAPVGSACKHSTKQRPPAGTCSCCLSRLACHDVFVTHVGAQEEGMQSTTGVCVFVCVYVCVWARARACVRACGCVYTHTRMPVRQRC